MKAFKVTSENTIWLLKVIDPGGYSWFQAARADSSRPQLIQGGHSWSKAEGVGVTGGEYSRLNSPSDQQLLENGTRGKHYFFHSNGKIGCKFWKRLSNINQNVLVSIIDIL